MEYFYIHRPYIYISTKIILKLFFVYSLIIFIDIYFLFPILICLINHLIFKKYIFKYFLYQKKYISIFKILFLLKDIFLPEQGKLMKVSAQNCSGVGWRKRRVMFNEIPEKVPEKVWEALVQSQVKFHRA